MRISAVLIGLCAVLLLEAEAGAVIKNDYGIKYGTGEKKGYVPTVYGTDHKNVYTDNKYGTDSYDDKKHDKDYKGDYGDDYGTDSYDDKKHDKDYKGDYGDDYGTDSYDDKKHDKDYKGDYGDDYGTDSYDDKKHDKDYKGDYGDDYGTDSYDDKKHDKDYKGDYGDDYGTDSYDDKKHDKDYKGDYGDDYGTDSYDDKKHDKDYKGDYGDDYGTDSYDGKKHDKDYKGDYGDDYGTDSYDDKKHDKDYKGDYGDDYGTDSYDDKKHDKDYKGDYGDDYGTDSYDDKKHDKDYKGDYGDDYGTDSYDDKKQHDKDYKGDYGDDYGTDSYDDKKHDKDYKGDYGDDYGTDSYDDKKHDKDYKGDYGDDYGTDSYDDKKHDKDYKGDYGDDYGTDSYDDKKHDKDYKGDYGDDYGTDSYDDKKHDKDYKDDYGDDYGTDDYDGKKHDKDYKDDNKDHKKHKEGEWGPWGAYGSCSAKCEKTRTRECIKSDKSYTDCTGEKSETVDCYEGKICSTKKPHQTTASYDVKTTAYYETTPYYEPTTYKGKDKTAAYQPSTYPPTTYDTPEPYHEKPDKYPSSDYGYSGGRYSWGQWEGWFGCSVSCGTGLQSRKRHCNPYGGYHEKAPTGRYVRAVEYPPPPQKYAPPKYPGDYQPPQKYAPPKYTGAYQPPQKYDPPKHTDEYQPPQKYDTPKPTDDYQPPQKYDTPKPTDDYQPPQKYDTPKYDDGYSPPQKYDTPKPTDDHSKTTTPKYDTHKPTDEKPYKLPAPPKPEEHYRNPDAVVQDPTAATYSEDFLDVYNFPEGYDSSDDPSANSYGCDGEAWETRTCRLDACAVNGGWTQWTVWTLCSVSCGEGGVQVRNRSCENPTPAYGGKYCRGVYSEIVTCSVPRACPTDGGWSSWASWSKCSITCGYGGTVYRGRTCTVPTPANGGATCEGDSRETNGCCESPCPIDGAWSAWSEWSEPSVTCGLGGTSQRFRRCDNPERAFGGKPCHGNDTEVKHTNLSPCPINGGWGEWSDYNKCSITCGEGGYQTRSRSCDRPSPDYGGKLCKGDALQAKVCSGRPCAIPGGWSNWFEWSVCSATCGFGGQKVRRRVCNHPIPLYDGEQCEGDSFDSVSCFIKHCPINCGWSAWTEWSYNAVAIGVRTNPMDAYIPEDRLDILRTRTGDTSGYRGTITYPTGTNTGASVQTIVPNYGGLGLGPDVPGVTCGYNGTKTRYRVGDNPEPQYGGKPCDGEAYESLSVPLPHCPVNGGWASWTEWTPNSVTCGDGGVSTRERNCTNPTPAYNGANCVGAYTELKSVPAPACPVCGGWTAWADWSDCSATCGYEGITSRSRSCTNPPPSYGGDNCEGESAQTTGCASPPCPISGGWGSWNEWSLCSSSCGPGGYTNRRRYCDTPAPLYAGSPCEGEAVESKPCVGPNCPINGSWSEWNSWSKPTVSCGEGGTQTRTRTCTEPVPAYGGRSCKGYPTETKHVTNAPCPIDGGWSNWSAWSSSGLTCGPGGTNSRSRECNSPAPAYGGKPCKGDATDTRFAPNPPCPPLQDYYSEALPTTVTARTLNRRFKPKRMNKSVHGGWNQWTPYSSCNVPCGDGGFVYRTRVCDKPAPAHNGTYCHGPSSEYLPCSSKPCPIHGNWGRWSEWSSSTATCGYGVVTRSRNCNAPSPANGGDQCEGVSSESKIAEIPDCPINGGWTSWSEWSQCSVSCGDSGKTQRYRYCEAPEPQYGGKSCEGEGVQTKPCAAPSCGVDGGWTEWQAWSKCSVSCGDGGFVTRVRTCSNPTSSAGGRYCKGLSSETKPGRAPPCPIDGGWGAWGRWSSCSISCGVGGYVERRRACDYPPPQYGGKDCLGDRVNIKNCTAPYCAIDGGWSSWQEWTRPDVSCGEGTIYRRRICDYPAPQYGGKPCAEDAVESKRYIGPVCPTDGGWSSWGDWTKPSSTCGPDGYQSRTRKCDNPSPANNGRNCHGPYIETKTIPLPRCAVDGGWNGWSEWSTCSVTCGFGGISTRSRRCDLPKPAYGGKQCSGDSSEKKTCYSSPCPVDGGWTSWSQWSKCSVTCGDGGTAKRSRSCENPEPSYGGRHCSGIAEETKSCSATPCPIDGSWSAWTEWSPCSVTCGEKGIVSRNRRCDRPPPSYAGRNCPGLNFESKNCTAPPCSIDGGWGEWGSWSKGSLSCGHGGMATRTRHCNRPTPLYGGKNCNGVPTETKYVFEKPCDNWTPWSTWTDCIQKCGIKPHKKRVRDCRIVKGHVYGKYIEEYCEGEAAEFKDCSKPHVYGSARTPYQVSDYGVNLQVPCCENWIVVLYRDSDHLSFNRTWAEYKKGFGSHDGNFFIGLDALHKLTKDGKYRVRYDVKTKVGGKWYYGEYKRLVIGSEDDQYTLNVENYEGDAGDMSYENGMAFTTYDRDNDKSTYSNCAKTSQGGWWYNACYQVNLHGGYNKHFVVKALAPDQYLKVAVIMIQRDPDAESHSDTYGHVNQ